MALSAFWLREGDPQRIEDPHVIGVGLCKPLKDLAPQRRCFG